jgi:hypothetical protein|tara:strand:+ start:42 stop:275 length:234 start_codon:yes stop_codon:yes gene_type:complete
MANKEESVKPTVTFTDKDGKEIKKNVEDLSDNSKLALVRIDEISKDKLQMQKNLVELDVLHKYYSNVIETEVKGEGE